MRKSTIWHGISAGLAFAALSGSMAFGASGPDTVTPSAGATGYGCNVLAQHAAESCMTRVDPVSVPAAAVAGDPAISSSTAPKPTFPIRTLPTTVTTPTPAGMAGAWSLQFQDNFDTLDRSVWTPYWFKDCAPGSVMNRSRTCSDNVSVAGGTLSLQMSAADKGALVSTNPKDGVPGHTGAAFGLGFYEARILFPGRCDTQIYNWPAWWTTGQSWPGTGENDIAEPTSGIMGSNYHSSGGSSGRNIAGCWAGQYHTYGLHRLSGKNDVYFDGILVHSYATRDGGVPHHLIVNVGYASKAQVYGPAGSVKVDYIRVWN